MDRTHLSLRRAASAAVIAGILTFISLGSIIAVSGGIVKPATFPNDAGFTQAVFWFEMAGSSDEVMAALGDPATETGRRIRSVMDATHRIDFIFMACYSAFTVSLFVLISMLLQRIGSPLQRPVLRAGLFFCCAALVGDIFETAGLLELTALADSAAIDAALPSLMMWTRVKSGALSMAGLLLAFAYARYFRLRFPGVLVALLFAASAIVGAIAITCHSARFMIEYAGSLGMFAWIMALAHAVMVRFFPGRA